DVVAIQGDVTVKSDLLTITYEEPTTEDGAAPPQSESVTSRQRLKEIVAEGNVEITTQDRRATGKKVVFNEANRTVVLSGNAVLRNVTIEVKGGEVVGLLGPNGAGKTTTFSIIIGIIRPDRGKVLYNDEDLTTLPMHERARKGVTYLPQEPSVFRKLTVEENILAILETLPFSPAERRPRLAQLRSDLHIEHLDTHRA